MKIKVQITLDVDAKGWREEFGIEPGDVRKDVQAYFETNMVAQLRDVLHLEEESA